MPSEAVRGTRAAVRSRSDARRHLHGALFGLHGNEGSDVIKGQADDDNLEGDGQNDRLYGGQGSDCLGAGCTRVKEINGEAGDDFLKSRDHVSGNDRVDGGANTDTCVIDAGDSVNNCEE